MNEKRKFNGEEALDTTVMRIMDLARWNPKNGAALAKKEKGMHIGEKTALKPKTVADTPKVIAPQVKLDTEGKIVLDEASLFVRGTRPDTSSWEVIDEDRCGRRITSNSFKKNICRKGVSWSQKETDLFYEILKCTGPDFGIMREYYPNRSRAELKAKYNREEKQNWYRVESAMRSPLALDDSLKDRADRLTKEIEEEAQVKEDKKKKTKDKTPAPPPTIDWDEAAADLVSEAEAIITALETKKEETESRADQKPFTRIEKKRAFPRKAKKTITIRDDSNEEDSDTEPLAKKKARIAVKQEHVKENEFSNPAQIEPSVAPDPVEPEQMITKIVTVKQEVERDREGSGTTEKLPIPIDFSGDKSPVKREQVTMKIAVKQVMESDETNNPVQIEASGTLNSAEPEQMTTKIVAIKQEVEIGEKTNNPIEASEDVQKTHSQVGANRLGCLRFFTF